MGGKVLTHGVDKPDLPCQKTGEHGRNASEKIGPPVDVAENGLRRMKRAVQVIVR